MSKECAISEILTTPRITANPDANSLVPEEAVVKTTGGVFQINNAKLYVPVVTLSIIDNIKMLENIKQELKWTNSWNKYRSELTTQPKSINLYYPIDSRFRNISRLFVLSFENGENDPTRDSFDKYYMLLVESFCILKRFQCINWQKTILWALSKKHTKRLWKTCWNVKKQCLYNRKLIRLFVSSKIL